MIKDNLREVEERIQSACERVERNRRDVTLIAVSKTKPISMIEEVMKEGIIDFGENKVQELNQKCEEIKTELNWHLIGHLQRNKVKYIIDKVSLIHSVDSLRLAIQIDEEAKKVNRIVPVLIEVNVAKEETKYGVAVEDTLSLIEEISKLNYIKIKGLMTIAPYVENPEENREHFRNLRKLSVDIKSKNIDNVDMDILSMGMTNDYQVAIEEGATMVRVGTGIFGEREYNKGE
ncbi:YggS family pyridoxal phosphate-dependent enzyme [Anaeromicropila herbilytica]|uniref:Pyridoxal phosphate homeostasis protein n=1 Tax=Anaeromicropila herbilytica TaxID=2785025 RepID=A0A7R7ELZ0_9FIRM|nr:YggS family pyridoxal phosphate-dependent enzyme [Anaeromicropila herbilytica]BCN31198.1 YggS family pyridoxal phosphate enzyme [Anaeromicropila herbilytica]